MRAISTIDAIKKHSWPYARTPICEITLHYNCNAKCLFCYSSPEIELWKKMPPMPFENICLNMKKSYKSGSRIIQFIGGEPSIYPGIEKAIKLSAKMGYKIIQMVTNGQKMSDINFAKKLFNSGLNSITFSIHSHIAEKHDKIVGIKGAFRKTIRAIENAIKNNIYITISTAITKLNYSDIPMLVKFLYEKYGIETYNFIFTHIIGLAKENKYSLSIRYNDTIPYIEKTTDFIAKKNILPISPIFSNVPPCILKGYEEIISDWKIPSSDDDMYLPEKSYKSNMYNTINSMLRTKSLSCRKCIYFKICAGFEKEYKDMFGTKEFIPLKSITKPIGINCFYRH